MFYLKIPLFKKHNQAQTTDVINSSSVSIPSKGYFEIKQGMRIRKSSNEIQEKNYQKIFTVKDIWVILKGGNCIFEYHKNGEDELQLNSILFGGFIYAIHSFAYQLVDQGLDKIRIHETEFKFIDLGDIILLSMVEEGLNELIVKNFLYKIGEKFIKLYYDRLNNLRDNWSSIKGEFTKAIDSILENPEIRYMVVLTTIKELCIKVYNNHDDLMLFYWHAIKLLRPLYPKELLLIYEEIRKFIDDLVKIDPIDTMQTLKNGFSEIVFHFVNSVNNHGLALNDINSFELHDSSDLELISSLLNYVS